MVTWDTRGLLWRCPKGLSSPSYSTDSSSRGKGRQSTSNRGNEGYSNCFAPPTRAIRTWNAIAPTLLCIQRPSVARKQIPGVRTCIGATYKGDYTKRCLPHFSIHVTAIVIYPLECKGYEREGQHGEEGKGKDVIRRTWTLP